MSEQPFRAPLSRGAALSLTSKLAAAAGAATSLGLPVTPVPAAAARLTEPKPFWTETTNAIERIIGAQGMSSSGVFSIEIDRDDIREANIHGVPVLPAFELNGTLFFQNLGGGSAIMNSDMALKATEINRFIDQLIAHDIVFQAEHQHFYDLQPLVWFIHFRAVGDPLHIARGVKAALNVTSTPFPQTMPKNPTTPLPAQALGNIFGQTPSIGSNGVVTIDVPRADKLVLGGVAINPHLNVATSIGFQPFGGGRNAAVAPDFALVGSEVNKVVGYMRARGWDIGCLYNQETDESPQLYFSHQFKTGDSLVLAREIRAALEYTHSQL